MRRKYPFHYNITLSGKSKQKDLNAKLIGAIADVLGHTNIDNLLPNEMSVADKVFWLICHNEVSIHFNNVNGIIHVVVDFDYDASIMEVLNDMLYLLTVDTLLDASYTIKTERKSNYEDNN